VYEAFMQTEMFFRMRITGCSVDWSCTICVGGTSEAGDKSFNILGLIYTPVPDILSG
jgi:hypothetical protein